MLKFFHASRETNNFDRRKSAQRMTAKVLFTDTSYKAADIQDEAKFRELSTLAEIQYAVPSSEDEMCRLIKDVDAVVIGEFAVTPRVIDAAPKLKLIAKCGVGYDSINVSYATQRGVFVTNVPSVLAQPVAEHAMLLILAVAKRLVMSDTFVRTNRWDEFHLLKPGFELRGKTLGIVGFGSIGSKLGEMARTAFGMKIIAFDPFVPPEKIRAQSAEPRSLEQVLSTSDIVSVNVPLSSETTRLVGEKEIRLMKPSAVLINTSRGKVLDEQALVKALTSGWIAAAGVDVLEQEPPESDNPLLKLENVTITPHTAAFTADATKALWLACFGAIIDVLKGERPRPPANILNPTVVSPVRSK